MARVCVYCGSSFGTEPAFAEAARSLGGWLAQEGHTLVYGGGNVGLMGVVADAALQAGGRVVGVIPEQLLAMEVGHLGLSELITVSSMHERKAKMAELSDCFVALPGGVGTLEEIIEVFVWSQLGIQAKGCGFLNVSGFYDDLMDFLKSMVRKGFMKEGHFVQLKVDDDPARLVTRLLADPVVYVDKRTNR